MALVNERDWGWLSRHKWYYHKEGQSEYAQRRSGCHTVRMHRVILEAPPGIEVDHRNHNGLDNRRRNLRLATKSQQRANSRSTSRFKGVSWNRWAGEWQARIQVKGKQIHLGYFKRKQDAAHAYRATARQYFGEFAFAR